jgi:uncharacterized protein YnzC (UPF0291/DUF896 family)
MANIKRINELARIAKERELTAEEIAERDVLRKEYIAEFRASFACQLDNTVIRRPDGTEESFRGDGKKKK